MLCYYMRIPAYWRAYLEPMPESMAHCGYLFVDMPWYLFVDTYILSLKARLLIKGKPSR